MWNSFTKLRRIRKALEYRGLDSTKLDVADLFCELSKRVPDKRLNDFAWFFVNLEPPSCFMTHCKNYGNSPSFCNCMVGAIPGRCKINKEYLARRKQKASLAVDELLKLMDEHFGEDVLLKIDTGRSYWTFYDNLINHDTKFAFLGKWNSSLREDAWKEIETRIKNTQKDKEEVRNKNLHRSGREEGRIE